MLFRLAERLSPRIISLPLLTNDPNFHIRLENPGPSKQMWFCPAFINATYIISPHVNIFTMGFHLFILSGDGLGKLSADFSWQLLGRSPPFPNLSTPNTWHWKRNKSLTPKLNSSWHSHLGLFWSQPVIEGQWAEHWSLKEPGVTVGGWKRSHQEEHHLCCSMKLERACF